MTLKRTERKGALFPFLRLRGRRRQRRRRRQLRLGCSLPQRPRRKKRQEEEEEEEGSGGRRGEVCAAGSASASVEEVCSSSFALAYDLDGCIGFFRQELRSRDSSSSKSG